MIDAEVMSYSRHEKARPSGGRPSSRVSPSPARPTIALRRARSSPEAVLLLGVWSERDTVARPVGHAEGAALAPRQPRGEIAGRPVDGLDEGRRRGPRARAPGGWRRRRRASG